MRQPTQARAAVRIGLASGLVITLAACGSSGSASRSASSTSRAPGSVPSNGTVAQAQSLATQSESVPQFAPPGPAFNATSAKGKSIFWIASSTDNAFEVSIAAAANKAANTLGIGFYSFPNSGKVSEYVNGMQLAIARHPSAIVLNAINPALIVPQIQQARQAGIDVIATLQPNTSTFPSGTLPGVASAYKDLTAVVYSPFMRTARLEADYVVGASGGHANVLILTSSNVIESQGIVEELKKEFEQTCGSGCSVTTADVPTTQWAQRLENQTQTSLNANPNINYIIPLYDSMTSLVLPGVLAAGKASSVKIVTFNGTVSILKEMESSPVVAADVGIDPEELGLLYLDQTMRVLNGLPTNSSAPVAVRTFTQNNVKDAGVPPQPGEGYGQQVVSSFAHLWKVQATGL